MISEKQVVTLNESDINGIVKEVVSTFLLEHSRTAYDDVMKENMTKSFEKLEEGVKDVLGMLTGWQMNTQGKSLSDYAKLFGYDTSAKRFIKALVHVEKAQKLINAAKNDMLGTDYPHLPVRVPKYKRLPKDFEREFLKSQDYNN